MLILFMNSDLDKTQMKYFKIYAKARQILRNALIK